MANPRKIDVVIIGAGAAGMMCAGEAARRGRLVLVIDHAEKVGEKIRISGGGRCNFTNLDTAAENFISQNPHFAKSALKRFTQHDFIARVDARGIKWHEKHLGQLFCDNGAGEIINMLVRDVEDNGGEILLETMVKKITRISGAAPGFDIATSNGVFFTKSLVIATGGKSIPKMGATGFGYEIANQMGLQVTETRAALVPLTFDPDFKDRNANLVGVATDVKVSNKRKTFDEAMLFTHRGMSGPAILQISSYWREGEGITIALEDANKLDELLKDARKSRPKQAVSTVLGDCFPKALIANRLEGMKLPPNMADCSNALIEKLVALFCKWQVTPAGSEGYRTAEVTLGGVDTNDLNSKTMEAKSIPGLYFIGEVVDVTGWLGGYNFQWAWSSGWAAGQVV